MNITSSSKIVREMNQTLKKTEEDINRIQENLRSVANTAVNWNDEQGQMYRELMKRIIRLNDAPRNTIREAIPKLDRMVCALEAYEKVKF